MTGSTLGRRLTGALGAVAIAAAGVCVLLPHLARSFFYADDFLNFAQAREHGLTRDYLVLPIYQHLAPGHRLLDWALSTQLGVSWNVAMALLMILYVIAVLAFWWLCAQLFGRTPGVLAITFLFALSVAYVQPMQWWAAAAHSIPALAFGLVALALAVRHVHTRQPALALAAALAFCTGLLFYTKGLLFLAYLVLIIVLFLQRDLRPPAVARALWRERWLLLAFIVPAVAYLVYYRSGPYGEGTVAPTLAALEQYLRILWLRGFAPTLLAHHLTADVTLYDQVVEALAQLFVIAVVAGSIALKRSAWRAWAFFAITAAMGVLLVGVTRVQAFGPGIGYDSRYWVELPMLFALALAFAFYGGDVAGAPATPATAARGRRVRGWLPGGRRSLAAGAAVLAVAYVVSFSIAADRIADDWPAGETGTYADNVRRSLSDLGRHGQLASPVGGQVPFSVVAGVHAPYNQLERVLPAIDEDITMNDAQRRLVVLDDDGRAHPARWHRAAQARDTCLAATAQPRLIELASRHPAGAPGTPAVRITPAPGSPPMLLSVFVDQGGAYGSLPVGTVEVRSDGDMTLVDLDAGPVRRVALIAPDGVRLCLRRLEFGVYATIQR